MMNTVKSEKIGEEAKLSSVSNVNVGNKKEILQMLNLEGAANFTVNINMAK